VQQDLSDVGEEPTTQSQGHGRHVWPARHVPTLSLSPLMALSILFLFFSLNFPLLPSLLLFFSFLDKKCYFLVFVLDFSFSIVLEKENDTD
jgi:hypothetical protein